MSVPVNAVSADAHVTSRGRTSRRPLLLGLAVASTTALATRVLAGALAHDGLSTAEVGILLGFGLTFAWLSSTFWTGLAGLLVLAFGGAARGLAPPGKSGHVIGTSTRTALVVPICHEDADAVATRLAAVVRSLAATGQSELFELFILSDSRDPAVIRCEQAAWARLAALPGAVGRVFYRNRSDNRGRKAGNIADFCRRWGGRYAYFVVLDADSVMTGAALVHLVALMEANPRAGLIQTLPRPVGATTLFARILQFGARLHGPTMAAGLALWFPGCANYWGHNAIVRMAAFTASAGLPELPGPPPLGGEILSHDFVEAALLRRAGWEVWLLPELVGSYEQLPPTLRELARRDRRWCQGNLQHLRVVAAKGLCPVSRGHLLAGAMSYLVAPLWLALLALATLEATQGAGRYGLPGAGGSVGAARGLDGGLLGLLGVTLAMLVLPKLLALTLSAFDRDRRHGFGGPARMVMGALAELVFSMLLAPVLMLQHSRAVIATLLGRGVTWGAQLRRAGRLGWAAGCRELGGCTLLALGWGLASALAAPPALLWLAPVLAGWLLAVPLGVVSSRTDLGRAARRRGWFVTPEEAVPPPVLQDLAPGPSSEGPGSRPAAVVNALSTITSIAAHR